MGFDGTDLAFDFWSEGSWHTHTVDNVFTLGPDEEFDWMHVAVSYDETEVAMYVNGTLVGEFAETAPLAMYGGYLGIGAEGDGSSNFLGLIDEVRISDEVLGPEKLGYNATLAAVPEPATILLLGSGFIGLFALGRKKFFKRS
jgi:hypothetical protein